MKSVFMEMLFKEARTKPEKGALGFNSIENHQTISFQYSHGFFLLP